jgi:hypothetical protein
MGFVLILFATSWSVPPQYHEFFTMKTCQEALVAVKTESKGAITGVCTPK